MALWLLVFSILLFIFSMLFKSKSIEDSGITTQVNSTNISQKNTTNNIETKAQPTNQTQQNTWIQNAQNETKKLSIQEQLISDFYKSINEKNFDNLINLTDIPLRQSNSYKTYYNSIRLTNFLGSISNNTMYITDIKEIDNSWWKARKYQYQIKYKLKTDNTLFTEERNASIVYKNEKNLIWSIMCVNKWCSQNPFFNPKKY
jgi:hypothetical protein